MRLRLIGFALAAVVIASGVIVARQTLSTAAEVETFANALSACTAATANTAHPLMPKFVIEHKVTGDAAGKCGYSQTMPGKMTMICGLSTGGRNALATELKQIAAGGGSVKGGTSQQLPAWMSECEILLPSGAKIPAVTPAKGAGS